MLLYFSCCKREQRGKISRAYLPGTQTAMSGKATAAGRCSSGGPAGIPATHDGGDSNLDLLRRFCCLTWIWGFHACRCRRGGRNRPPEHALPGTANLRGLPRAHRGDACRQGQGSLPGSVRHGKPSPSSAVKPHLEPRP